MDYYVDNLDGLRSTESEGQELLLRLRLLTTKLGLDLHELRCAQRFKHLGWLVDTVSMTLQMPESRLQVVLGGLKTLQQDKIEVSLFTSLLGLLTWLTQVLFWLRPALGHMRAAEASMRTKDTHLGRVSRRLKHAAGWAEKVVRSTNGMVPITAFHWDGDYDTKTMAWNSNAKDFVLTVWADANVNDSRGSSPHLVSTKVYIWLSNGQTRRLLTA